MQREGTNGSATAPRRRGRGGPRKGDRRREAILDAIDVLLRERSIAELSVEEIAAAAGISRSGFYFYFESKYAALGDALGDLWTEMARAAEEFLAGSDDPPRVFVPRALAGVADVWRRHDALLIGMHDAAATDPGARALWDDWVEKFIAAVAERIELDRSEGRAPAGPPDADALARVLVGMNEQAFYDDRRRRAPADETARIVAALARAWTATIWERPA